MKEAWDLLSEGACWKFFSLLFRCPSDEPFFSIGTLIRELAPDVRSQAQATIGSLLDDSQLEAAYHRLLGSGGPVSPYESDYQGPGSEGMRERGVVMGDVAAFYKAFAFDASKEMLEAPDHLAIELAFMSFLKLKEAYACMDGDEDAYRLCLEAEHKFLGEHLLVWAPEFVERVLERGAHEFHERSARLLGDFLARQADEAVARAAADTGFE